ncbi:myosin/kinesin family protein [Yersinia aleksiciae]|uniref:hypothetical protein n=1 Tax=Yersinia aleksiciae TaxID=263819 RepID=UPI0011A2B95E|nr:hypothetical protein [Yersinia aleksiciae]
MKKLVFVITLGLLISLPTYGKSITPPLGLSWGMNKGEVEKQADGVSLLEEQGHRLRNYYLKNPSEKIDGMDGYSVYIDDKYGLVSVEMLQSINDDANGSKIKKRYETIKNALSKKYGKPDSIEYVNNDRVSFYKCLSSSECGNMYSFFTGTNGQVYVSINSMGDDYGQIYIRYKVSEFDKTISEIQKQETDELSESL